MQLRPRRKVAKATFVAAIAATLFASGRAEAQAQTQLAITGGTGTDQRGVHSDALTVAPSLLIGTAVGAALSLGASLTRFGNQAWSLGGAAAFSGRDAIAGPVAVTLDASANASRLDGGGGGQSNASASFASGDLVPALQLDAGPLTLFGGVRAATGYASQDVARQPLPVFNGGTTTQTQTRSAAGPTFGATFAMSSPRTTMRLGAREDRLRVSGVAVADRALSLNIATDAVSLAGSVGRRSASDEQVGFGSAVISIPLGRDVALDAAGGRYASNRLTGTPGGDYVNVGFSLRFGGGAPALPAALPSARVRGAPGVAKGYTRLAIDAPDAERVEIAGDFNDWTPVAATRVANGVWYADLRIAPGQYRYAFRVNGKEWRVPRGATAAHDEFGGKSAWLIVAAPSP
jgi:hypothetical protein